MNVLVKSPQAAILQVVAEINAGMEVTAIPAGGNQWLVCSPKRLQQVVPEGEIIEVTNVEQVRGLK